MASFTGPDGTFLHIAPVAYQFPGHQDNDDDANWLVIEMRANDGAREWSSRDPALQTWEVASLIRWLISLEANASGVAGRIYFTEPNVHFESTREGNSRFLHVTLEQEFAPPGPGLPRENGEIRFPWRGEQVRRFADELRAEMEAFPIRVVEPDGYAANWLKRWGSESQDEKA